jgi:hypothetical protein
MRPTNALAAAVLSCLLAAGLTACGGDEPTVEPAQEQPAGDQASLAHIHGLGVGPADGTLYVATHTGLFEAAEGEQQLRRIGDSEQDIMGFSVVGGDRFIGSGHPAPDDANLPPNLGLIESRDAGRTWKSISLLGEADFHVLQSAGKRIYGFDGTQGRLMISSDGGRRWTQRAAPAAMFDLAIDPRNPDHIVASTERGVLCQSRSWRTAPTSTSHSPTPWSSARAMAARAGPSGPHREPDGELVSVPGGLRRAPGARRVWRWE